MYPGTTDGLDAGSRFAIYFLGRHAATEDILLRVSVDLEMLTTNARPSSSGLDVVEGCMLTKLDSLSRQQLIGMTAVPANNATSLIPR